MEYEILGIGNPLIDYIIHVDDAYLASLSGFKGGMEIVDHQTIKKIVSQHPPSLKLAGGSTVNTIKGLASLGKKCAVTGKIGNDAEGKELLATLAEKGIVALFAESSLPTGHAACLITPDGQRTCRTYVGPMSTFRSENLNPAYFENVKLVYLEGYNLLYDGVTEKAMMLAKQAGAKVAFTLSSMEIALGYKSQIVDLAAKYIDILFANEDECFALTQLKPNDGCHILKDLCEIVVIHGISGCWLGQKHYEAFIPTEYIRPLDSTGAGDVFASGFLYGYLSGAPLEKAVAYGARAGKEVVQILGAELPDETWEKVIKSPPR